MCSCSPGVLRRGPPSQAHSSCLPGCLTVQIAKRLEAQMIGVCSTQHVDVVCRLNAEQVARILA